jgi:hypothetical protein
MKRPLLQFRTPQAVPVNVAVQHRRISHCVAGADCARARRQSAERRDHDRDCDDDGNRARCLAIRQRVKKLQRNSSMRIFTSSIGGGQIGKGIQKCPQCKKPKVVFFLRNRFPPNRGSFNSTHVYGTRVPVEESRPQHQ